MLAAEGITDDTFVTEGSGPDSADWIAHGEIGFDWSFPPTLIGQVHDGVPIKILTGLYSGCLELFADVGVATAADLKGKKLGMDRAQSACASC